MTQLYSVRQNVGTALGEVWKWGVSLNPEQSMTAADLAYSLRLSTMELKTLLFVNGATELNGFLCFESEESCQLAVKMLEVKIELDGTTPLPVAGSSTGNSQVNIEVIVSEEDWEGMNEEWDGEVDNLADLGDEDAKDAWADFLEDRGIDVHMFSDDWDITYHNDNGVHKLKVVATI